MEPRVSQRTTKSPRERLVFHVQELERLEAIRQDAADLLKDAFQAAKNQGYDTATLKVVLKLRKMTTAQRRERRALELIYLAALDMLEGDALTDEARRRLDPDPAQSDLHEEDDDESVVEGVSAAGEPPTDVVEEPADDAGAGPDGASSAPAQPVFALKTPAEAHQDGAAAAAAGKRIYDNPYSAGDACRAAWDEGWCAQRQSHGMDTPSAYQRRTAKRPDEQETAS